MLDSRWHPSFTFFPETMYTEGQSPVSLAVTLWTVMDVFHITNEDRTSQKFFHADKESLVLPLALRKFL